VIGRGQTRDLSEIQLPVGYWAEVAEGRLRAFLYGWVEYDDVFEKRHRMEFSVRIHVIGDVSREDVSFGFPSFGKYNGIDNHCKYKPGEKIPIADAIPGANIIAGAAMI
jgi:hypothetical protein